ncbi:MAG: sugar transferase [Clostridia bacterium]|nr:sugar transferase [Clostridia bacterium]
MYKRVLKRGLDILLSIIGLILTSPILLMTSIAIRIESKGPIIFKQNRIGEKGKVFKIYKFRSMIVGAEKGGVYETKGDKRVTKVGKFIRKTSIDELPQLLNILKGEMSIIGPRPVLTYHPWKYEEYNQEQLKRFEIKPGVTGLAQVNGRKDVEWNRRIEFDVEYVKKVSFIYDLRILFKTISKVFLMKDNVNVGETVVSSSEKIEEKV